MNISTSQPTSARWRRRLRGLGVLCGVVGIWAVLSTVQPRSSGHGTHTQLGLQSCGYLARTGYPCPGCGMTTSLSAAADGDLSAAFRAQPFGLVLGAALLGAGLAGTAEALGGGNVLGRVRPRWWWLAVVAVLWLLGWAITVASGLAAGKYPLAR